jgi:hypothetical protein
MAGIFGVCISVGVIPLTNAADGPGWARLEFSTNPDPGSDIIGIECSTAATAVESARTI